MSENTANNSPEPAATSAPGERLAEDMAAVVRQELQKLKGELAETTRRAGTGGLLLAAAGGCALLGIGAASTTVLRLLETFLPRRLAAFGLTAGYLTAAAVLAAVGLERLREAGGSSERLADETRRAVSATLGR